MNKKEIQELLAKIVNLKNFCEKRFMEKMDAKKIGFGKHNQIESICFENDEISTIVIDSGYDLRDTASISLDLDEICMTDEEWKDHLIKLKQQIDAEREAAKKKEKEAEYNRRRQKYLKLKEEFEEKNT